MLQDRDLVLLLDQLAVELLVRVTVTLPLALLDIAPLAVPLLDPLRVSESLTETVSVTLWLLPAVSETLALPLTDPEPTLDAEVLHVSVMLLDRDSDTDALPLNVALRSLETVADAEATLVDREVDGVPMVGRKPAEIRYRISSKVGTLCDSCRIHSQVTD